jgi:DNA-binding HxlR family transcriptional regulator
MSNLPEIGNDYSIQLPIVKFKSCPISATVSVLGKKWTLLILRDIALFKINRFNQIKKTIPELTSRVLTMRLNEMEEFGLIQPVVIKDKPRLVKWILTEKGYDTIPILMNMIAFGTKWCANAVFEDRKSRTIEQVYPNIKY